jgi:nicotinamidase-related amidase
MVLSLDLNRAALVLVDIQRDFVHPEGLFARRFEAPGDAADLAALVGNCQRLIGAMHATNRPVVFVKEVFRPDYADCAIAPVWVERGLDAASGFVVEGTWGAELMDGLAPEPRDYVLIKKGHGAFQHTHLDRLLGNLGVEHLLVTGGTVAGCVSDTVRMGAALGYEQFVVTDAVYPARSPHLDSLVNRVDFIATADVLAQAAALGDAPPRPSEPAREALLVIDMQNDFLHPDGAMHRHGQLAMTDADRERVVANTRRLADAVRARDWPVIWVRVAQRADVLDTALAEAGTRRRGIPPEARFIERGGWGAALVDGLTPEPHDLILDKHGHSAFGFTPLHRILRNLRVRRCLVAGGVTNGCVSDTVREGVGLGYAMTIVSDATYPPDDPYLEVLANRGAVRATADVLAGLLRAAAGAE